MKMVSLLNSFNKNFKSQSIIFIIIILLGSCFTPLSLSKIDEKNYGSCNFITEGSILFAPMYSTTTYLVDNDGSLNHTWPCSYLPGVAVWWLQDYTILRTIRVGVGSGGGAGGGVQKIEEDGSISWDFRYNTNGVLSHHDIKTLPNGNILLIAWEDKTRNEVIDAGRNPSYVGFDGLTPDHVIEVEPTGPTSGDIVWEWHVWDHLIQDYDPTKDNYGVVGDHPELVDVNYVTSTNIDWMHTNSVDYNEDFDQIMISVHNFNEIWVIDHSTTTAEAAGHTGGNSGKGGDLLYRWGNPQAYRRGTSSDRRFYGQHDATWIKEDYPGEGNILVFNNGLGRGYSSVDEITPPVDGSGNYYLQPGLAYGPDSQTWIYTANPPSSFYTGFVSGASRLSNGNTIISDGSRGYIFEVNTYGEKVWQYTNPYPAPYSNSLFKVVFVPKEDPPEPEIPDLDCTGSLSWDDVSPGITVTGSFNVENIGGSGSLLNWAVDISSIDWGEWTFNPESGQDLSPDNGEITVQVSVVVPEEKNTEFEGFIRVENLDDPEDFELVPVYLKTPVNSNSFSTLIYLFLQKIFNFLQGGYLYNTFLCWI